MSATPAAVEKVTTLLTTPRSVELEHGRKEYFIPGPECHLCKGTGYVRLNGHATFRGQSRYNSGCHSCHRDPMQYLCDRVLAHAVRDVLREKPELR